MKRGKLEERVVLEAILKDTLDEAFQTLKERLDPAPDQFDAANTFRQLLWPVGESVHDFAARYLEEGLKAGLNARQICIFMTTQLPIEVRLAAKEWIIHVPSCWKYVKDILSGNERVYDLIVRRSRMVCLGTFCSHDRVCYK